MEKFHFQIKISNYKKIQIKKIGAISNFKQMKLHRIQISNKKIQNRKQIFRPNSKFEISSKVGQNWDTRKVDKKFN